MRALPLPALWMGLRVDAKWLSLSLVPAYLILLLAYWKPFFYKYSTLFAGLGLTCMVLLDAVNFGFFSFYKTPISPLVFGFLQDDTKAILQTLWHDWPIFSYLFVLFAGVAAPLLISAFSFNRIKANPQSSHPCFAGSDKRSSLGFFYSRFDWKIPSETGRFRCQ